MKIALAGMLLILISVTGASGQTTITPSASQMGSVFGPDPTIRITTVFQARIESVADPRGIPTSTAQDGARRIIYNMAANECTILAEFWKGECRLNSLSLCISSACIYDAVLANVDGQGLQPEIPSIFGTAVYEVRPMAPLGR